MASKKKLLVIVPPDGSPVRSMRIRVALIVFLCVLFLAGFGGYFIPLSSTTINVVEHNEKNNLQQQNTKLKQITPEAFKLSGLLRKDIRILEKKIEQLHKTSGLNMTAEATRKALPFKKTQLSFNKINELCAANAAAVSRLYTVLTATPEILSNLPVNYPVITSHTISTRFGRINDPFTNTVKWHYGTDFVAPLQTPVIATAAGTILSVENDRIWGKRVVISHRYGFSTVYAHVEAVSVYTGKKVKKGDPIATVGISGVTTGPHLHYEIWRNGNPVNPEDLFFPDPDMFFTNVSDSVARNTPG